MKDVPDERLQEWIDRMRTGDEAAREEARQKLISLAAERLHRLAHKILRTSFRRLGHAHETGSVLDESVIRLLTALRQVHTPTVQDFFRLAAMHIRYVLLDMAREPPRPPGPIPPEQEPADSREGPEALARWIEFHKNVEELPEGERAVVNVCWYLGLKQAQAAEVLGIHPREVSRRWVSAISKLPDPEM